jgi:hypothetical protein
MTYFIFEESMYENGKYVLTPNFPLLPLKSTLGSYNILAAEIMGLSYANFLRMCRDLYGAEVVGKGHYYPVAYFKNSKDGQPLIDELNKRVEVLLKARKKDR